MMDDSAEEFCVDDFSSVDLKKKLDDVKRIVNDPDYEGNKLSSVLYLLQSCIEMINSGKNALEFMKKDACTPSIIVADLISYEKGVIVLFEHCSESSLIYGDLITSVKQSLTELFKKTSDIQILFFSILEKVQFDLTLKGDLDLLLSALQHIWYGAKAVYKASNKIMTTNWKVYITILQKYSTELKKVVIIDEPIDFLCAEIKKKVLSLQYNDEPSLKLTTYMMSVLSKLYSYGCILESHNVFIEFILFLNSYWLSDKQDVVAVKERLQKFVDQLVLISDETFAKVFQSICQGIINNNCANQKISTLYTAMLLLKRFSKTQYDSQLTYEIINIVFQLIKCTDSVMCWYSLDIYEPLLVNLASVILISDYNLFENVETILIHCILNTDYWPAMLSCDLWIIITRYLSSDLQNTQFTKLARLLEELSVFPCFTQSPQCIYLESLLRRHFSLITDKKQLVNTCPQFKTQNLKSAVGILHVPTLSNYNRLSDLVKMITLLPEQNKYEHLNEEILHLWNCVQNDYPPNFICALVETTEILSIRNVGDTTEMKRCRLRLIRSLLLCMPKFQEKLVMENFLEYLFDHHPLVRQWTVETIVYFSSVAGNQNNLISMLFKHPEIRTVVTDYLEMKIDCSYNHNDFVQHFERLSIGGRFQHTCSINGKLGKLVDKLEVNIVCLNDIVCKTQISTDELERLKKCSSLLNNICTAMEFNV